MKALDVKYLHTGEPVLVLEEGSGEPGTWNGTGPNAQWVENRDYKPSRIVRLGTVEDAEPGQIADSYDATSTVAREEAIAAGELGDRPTDVSYVHEPEAATDTPVVPGGSPVVGAATDADRAELERLRADEATETEQQQLTDAERAELEQLRHEAAQRQAADADVARDTTPS